MYYSPAQMLAHLTVNGASLRTGDLLGSGTISGPAEGPAGIAAGAHLGTALSRCELGDGARTFLADGDEVVLRGSRADPRSGRSGWARSAAGSSR